MKEIKIRHENGKQIVEIPSEYNFGDDELLINKIGNVITLTPKKDRLATMIDAVNMFSDDFMEDDRNQSIGGKRDCT